MSVVIVQDDILHYEVLGRGRPLIFIHSWVGSWRYWIPTMQAASISFRAYAIDLWGFGDSAKNPSKYSLEVQSRLLDDFLERLGIGRVAIIGHGLGSLLALDYASRNPDVVDRVMAVGFPMGSECINPRLASGTPSELANWLLASAPDADSFLIEAAKADHQALLSSLEDLEEIDLAAFCASIPVPCLYVNGQNDQAVEPPSWNDLAHLPEHNHHIVFDQSAHFPMLEENSKFNRLLGDFLSLASGESPRHLQLKEEWKRRVR
jgi:pimeloyl-ACP methyl ester carboxylesterase